MRKVVKNLLIISCSKSKNRTKKLLPAIERYTGAWYEVISKLKKENKFPSNLDIVIISAKYGFLKSTDLIEDYDLRMDEKRARGLNYEIMENLNHFLEKKHYNTIFINLGKDYLPAIHGLEDITRQDTKVIYAKGRVGERKSQMKNWILSLEK